MVYTKTKIGIEFQIIGALHFPRSQGTRCRLSWTPLNMEKFAILPRLIYTFWLSDETKPYYSFRRNLEKIL